MLTLVLFVSGCTSSDMKKAKEVYDIVSSYASNDDYEDVSSIGTGTTLVEDIDVGQGDAFLISNESFGSILVDSGDNEHSKVLTSHLKQRGIKTLDYVILTHPHSDHIGGMVDILDNFNVKEIYMPKMTHSSYSFKNLVSKMKENNLKFTEAKSGVNIKLDKSSIISFVSPTKNMDLTDLDNSDAVFLLKTNNKKILFTADVFSNVDNVIVPRVGKIDILKVAHHGSYKGTSKSFLLATRPTYAMIGVGKDNRYSHPSKDTITRLKNRNVKIYRTDLNGNISFFINEKGEISVKCDKEN